MKTILIICIVLCAQLCSAQPEGNKGNFVKGYMYDKQAEKNKRLLEEIFEYVVINSIVRSNYDKKD